MHFYCAQCKKIYLMNTLTYQCECGGLFKLYKEPNEEIIKLVSLGEGETPMIEVQISNMNLHFKVDYLCPTGSFKDRGACTLINYLKALGIQEIIEDSSGNAGAAIAAYAAAAGIRCSIYVPENTSPGKIRQVEAYGAQLVKVPGQRDDTAVEIKKAAEHTYYASHVYNPLFFEGIKSLAHEIYKQVGIPDYIFVPTGNGTMLLGLYAGFEEIGKLPRLIAVQSEKCKPIYNAFYDLEETPIGSTAAEGIAIGKPMRLKDIVTAVRNSQGEVVTVSDEAVLEAQSILGGKGLYTEITSAAALAGAIQYFPKGKPDNYKVVIPLTGIGLKK